MIRLDALRDFLIGDARGCTRVPLDVVDELMPRILDSLGTAWDEGRAVGMWSWAEPDDIERSNPYRTDPHGPARPAERLTARSPDRLTA